MATIGEYLNNIPSKGVSETTRKHYPLGTMDYNEYPIRDFIVGPQIPSTEYLLEQYPYWEQQARQNAVDGLAEPFVAEASDFEVMPSPLRTIVGYAAPRVVDYLKGRVAKNINQNSGFRM